MMVDISHSLRLYLITDDRARSAGELADIVGSAIEGGVTAVQFREKALGPTTGSKAFEAVAKVCCAAGIPLFINADLLTRFEITCQFAGVHYSDRTLPLHPGNRTNLSGYSAHGVDDALRAFSHDVDFCTLSPIFPTPSKAGILAPVGTRCISESRKQIPDRPLVALGGVNESNAAKCMEAGATGVATIRAVMDDADPAAAAARLREIIEKCVT